MYATIAWGTDAFLDWIRCLDMTSSLMLLGLDLEGLDLDCNAQVAAEQTSWSDTPLSISPDTPLTCILCDRWTEDWMATFWSTWYCQVCLHWTLQHQLIDLHYWLTWPLIEIPGKGLQWKGKNHGFFGNNCRWQCLDHFRRVVIGLQAPREITILWYIAMAGTYTFSVHDSVRRP